MESHKFKTVDEYHAAFPKDVRELLEKLRKAIRQAAPQAEECISYNMPAYKLHGSLVYYAANRTHIGFYPTSSPMRVFKDELAAYKTGKGSIRFPLETGIPVSLVKTIVAYRVQENIDKAAKKAGKK